MYVPCLKSGCKVAGIGPQSGRPCSGTCGEVEGLHLPGPDKGLIPHQDNDDLGGNFRPLNKAFTSALLAPVTRVK